MPNPAVPLPDGWTASVARLGGDVALVGAPPPRTQDWLVAAWVAVQIRPGDAEGGTAPDADVAAVVAALDRVLGRTARPWVGAEVENALLALDPPPDPLFAGAHVARLAHALGVALRVGLLSGGTEWRVQVEDSTGTAPAALGPVLGLLGGLADGWDPTLAPPVVHTDHGRFVRDGAGYRLDAPAPAGQLPDPDVCILLEHDGDPTDPLPVDLPAPGVVVRPADRRSPGPPRPPGPPPNPGPAAAAVARWCFGVAEPDGEMLSEATGLFDGTWPATPRRLAGLVGETWRLREAADLLLDAWPAEAAALCLRAQVEAFSGRGSRIRAAGLVDAAVRSAGEVPSMLEPLRSLRRTVRVAGHPDWVEDLWVAADRHHVDAVLIEDEVLDRPDRAEVGEIAVVLARRLERAKVLTGALRAGKDGER